MEKTFPIKEKEAFWMIAVVCLLSYVPFLFFSLSLESFFIEYDQLSIPQTIQLVGLSLFIGLPYGILILAPSFHRISIRFKHVFLLMLPLLILLLFIPPLISRDSALYLLTARNLVEHQANPYTIPLNQYPNNEWFQSLKQDIYWLELTSFYGPVFNVYMAPFGALYGLSLLTATFILKSSFVLIFILNLLLFWKILRKLDLPSAYLAFFAFNPVMLFHGILEGHNDLLVLLFILLFLYFAISNKRIISSLPLSLAVGMKFFPIILLPAIWIKDRKILWKTILLSLLVVAATFLSASAVFGFPFQEILSGIKYQSSMFCMQICSPPIAISDLAFGFFLTDLYRKLGSVLLMGLCAISLLFMPKTTTHENLIKYIFWMLMILLFISVRWLAPWYFIPLLPFGILLMRNKWYPHIVYFLTMFALLSFLG